MRTYTNLAWPEDPYRTGQQLYRRPTSMLTAFTIAAPARGSRYGPMAAATVYLPLHRTRALAVTEQTLVFGFRAASIDDHIGAAALAAAADLDLMRARRHAAILAGHVLPGEVAALRLPLGGAPMRGLAAVQRAWRDRHVPAPGGAAMFDCLLDLPGHPSLLQACQRAGIAVSPGFAYSGGFGGGLDPLVRGELAAAHATERALIIALVCARHLSRCTWPTPLHSASIMTDSVWDCFAHLRPGRSATPLACLATAADRTAAARTGA